MAAIQYPFTPTGTVGDTQLVHNTAVGLSALRVAHATYSFAVDGGGAPGLITPASNATIPINAVIYNVAVVVSSDLLAAGGAATIAVGTSAGSAANSLMTATNKTSWTASAKFVQGVPVPQTASTWVKMSAAGSITLTSATNALTAGVAEIYVFYIESAS